MLESQEALPPAATLPPEPLRPDLLRPLRLQKLHARAGCTALSPVPLGDERLEGAEGSGGRWLRKGAGGAVPTMAEGGREGRRAAERPGASAGRPYVLEAAFLELLDRGVLGRLLQPLGAVGRADVQPQHLARENLLLLHEHRAAAARDAARPGLRPPPGP